MINPTSSITAVRCDRLDSDDDAAVADLYRHNATLQAELDEVEPVISAALLAATAFRLRDQEGLVSALRLLVRATRWLEGRRACA